MGCSPLGTGQDGDGQEGRAERSIHAPNCRVPSLVPTCGFPGVSPAAVLILYPTHDSPSSSSYVSA